MTKVKNLNKPTVMSKVETTLLALMSRKWVSATTVTILLRFAKDVTSVMMNSTLTPSWFMPSLANPSYYHGSYSYRDGSFIRIVLIRCLT